MANKYLDQTGLAYYDAQRKIQLEKKADKTEIPKNVTDLADAGNYVTQEQLGEAGGTPLSNTTPKMDGEATAGVEEAAAHGDHVHPHDSTKLDTNGDASNLTVSFNTGEDDELTSGDTLGGLLGSVKKGFEDLGDLAYADTVTDEDLSPDVKDAIEKAKTALQSYTETDPTVPDWAKQSTKPTYTADEVGAIPATRADEFALKSDLTSVYTYKGSKPTYDELPEAGENEVGDVWNVEETDMNYGWTGSAWDPLGQIFEIEPISNTEIDQIMGINAYSVATASAKIATPVSTTATTTRKRTTSK